METWYTAAGKLPCLKLVKEGCVQKSKLMALLRAHKIPIQKWGTGEAKDISHLLAEINTGETVLKEALWQGKMRLFRRVRVCIVQVYYRNSSQIFHLREDKQVFSDGRERVREYQGSVSEKMRPRETPYAAAQRALREELHIKGNITFIPGFGFEEEPHPSNSFPGIMSVFHYYHFDAFLPTEHYKRDGYVEELKDMKTYFVWEEVHRTKTKNKKQKI
jgi:uncharacterized protein YkuJ